MNDMLYMLLKGVANPSLIVKTILRLVPKPFPLRVAFDHTQRPAYAQGIYSAARQAKLLDLKDISVIELGVAGGRGLVVMESLACTIAKETGINIKVYGFDLKVGLPTPQDYRDTPYIYQEGFFPMNEGKLRARLRDAELVLGDVSDTIPAFLLSGAPPIGFVAVDLDFYSSTRKALDIFSNPDYGLYLPRIIVYFDDILSHEDTYRCEFVGELLAVREFNQQYEDRKIAKIHGFRYTRLFPAAWNEQMYVCHLFSHPLYCRFIGSSYSLSLG